MIQHIRVGTRKTPLALKQTEIVIQALQAVYPELTVTLIHVNTLGDQNQDKPLPEIGGKGAFTSTLEEALLEGELDLAVHSLKDLPTQSPKGLINGAILAREDIEDVLISPLTHTLDTLPQGACIGTSSLRRGAQLLHYRADLRIESIRGSVQTRIDKAYSDSTPYDAIVLARAGINRLNKTDLIRQVLPLELMLPSPGQGALAVQCRDEAIWHTFLKPIHHLSTFYATQAERDFLRGLGGGCSQPIAAYAQMTMHGLHLIGRVNTLDGRLQWQASLEIPIHEAHTLGQQVAQAIIEQGAILE
jgi:hydroxymethylbilane synthase